MTRRILLCVLVGMLALLPAAIGAQGEAEQTILDAVIVMHPPDGDDLCVQLGAGQLTVVAQVIQESAFAPAPRPSFDLSGYMVDPNASITMRVTPNESTSIVHLAGAMYCWRLWVDPRALPSNAAQMSNAERGAFVQQVHLRMTFTPQ